MKGRVERNHGKFNAKAIVVRQINNIEIVFYDSHSIYVKSEHGVWVVFHRWFAREGAVGSYKSWRGFRTLLFYESQISFAGCHRLAFKYDIPSQVSRAPDLKGKTVEIVSITRRKKS